MGDELEEFRARIVCAARVLTPGFSSQEVFSLYKKRYKTDTTPYMSAGYKSLSSYLESGDIPAIQRRQDGKFFVVEFKEDDGRSIRDRIVKILAKKGRAMELSRILRKLDLRDEKKARGHFGFEDWRSIPEMEVNGQIISFDEKYASRLGEMESEEKKEKVAEAPVEEEKTAEAEPVATPKRDKRKKPVVIEVSSDDEEGREKAKKVKIAAKDDDSAKKPQLVQEKPKKTTEADSTGSGGISKIDSSVDQKTEVIGKEEGEKATQFTENTPNASISEAFQEMQGPPAGCFGEPFCPPGLFPHQMLFPPPMPQYHLPPPSFPSKYEIFGQYVTSTLAEAERKGNDAGELTRRIMEILTEKK